jgi:hypothetical protein
LLPRLASKFWTQVILLPQLSEQLELQKCAIIPTSTFKKTLGAGDLAQVIECLPGKHETLRSIPKTTQKMYLKKLYQS